MSAELATFAPGDSLPSLIDRATAALSAARTSAEVLEARDLARAAYDAAKSAGRMARAKEAHDEIIGAVYRAQADALLIEARAKMRLADEIDAAKERGELATHGGKRGNVDSAYVAPATTEEIGLRRDEVQEARAIRDAEKAEPGKVERAVEAVVASGKEPTKEAVKRELGVAKERNGLSALSRQGLEEEVLGLRAENAELRERVKKQTHEIARLKSDLKEALETDRGRALGNAMRERDTANGRMKELQRQIKSMEFRMKKAEEERDGLRAQLADQVVEL